MNTQSPANAFTASSIRISVRSATALSSKASPATSTASAPRAAAASLPTAPNRLDAPVAQRGAGIARNVGELLAELTVGRVHEAEHHFGISIRLFGSD